MGTMNNTSDIFKQAGETGRAVRRRLVFDLVHPRGNGPRTDRQDPLKGTAPHMLPWGSRRMVTGSRSLMKYAGYEPVRNDMELTRENILAEHPDVDPAYALRNRYDPLARYRPGATANALGRGTRRFGQFVGTGGPLAGGLKGALMLGGAGLLTGLVGKSRGWSPVLLAALGALGGAGLGSLAGRVYGKQASFWETGASEQLMRIVSTAAGLTMQERAAMSREVASMPPGRAREILSALGPTLGGAGIGALLVKLILGGGKGRMTAGALAGAVLANLLKGGGEDPGAYDMYGRRIAL